jgi:hypothetical protein
MAKHETEVPLGGTLSGAPGARLADRSANEHDNHDVTADRIRMRAYELYLERGTEPDNALEDWLQAEREFRRAPDEETDALEVAAPRGGSLGGGPPHARL